MSAATEPAATGSVASEPVGAAATARPHEGMPPLDQEGAPLSFFEFWPMRVFYLPVFFYTLWLMIRYRGITLPTVANPSFPGGGYYGESKSAILELGIRHAADWVAPFVTVDRGADAAADLATAVARLAEGGLTLPVVAKPDMGCRGAGVRLVKTPEELAAYVMAFPPEARLILQRYVPFEGEAGVFYVRKPGEGRGRIISLTLKYFPYVHGDGRSTLRELILADPRAGQVPHLYLGRHADRLDWVPPAGQAVRLAFAGSHSRGSIFRDGTHLVTPAMEARFDSIARSLPEFYFGRFDIRFPSFERLQQGEDFTIIEINGAGAEVTHIWDRRTSILAAWRSLMRQYRLLYQIGRINKNRGHRPMTLSDWLVLYRREKALTALYPPTQ